MNKNPEQLKSDDILRMVQKYALVLLVLEVINRFGHTFIVQFYFQLFPIDSLSNLNDIRSVITASTILLLNIIVGLIILQDLDRSKGLTWIILLLTLLAPWLGVMFLLIWRVVDMKNAAQQNI